MPGYHASSILAVQDISTPSASEFLKHPDHRQIASFFLGWVFISSLLCIVTSPVMRHLSRRCSRIFDLGRLTNPTIKFYNKRGSSYNDVQKSMATFFSDDQGSRIRFSEGGNRELILILSICFAFASIGYFLSLLSFQPGSGSSACAFVVAWGGISAALARFLGLIILNLDLRKFALRRWEMYLAWSWLVVSGAFVFATYAINVGVVAYVHQLGTYLCYRTIYPPIASTMSVMFITLELYIVCRLLSLIAPPFLEFRHRIGAVMDTRVLRALSLLLLELFCLAPGVKFIDVVGEFVPFSIGALIVLAMFHKHRTKPILGEPMPVPPMSLPGSRAPTIRISIVPSLSTQTHIPSYPFAVTTQSPPSSHIHRASIESSISFNASPEFGTDIVKIASRSRHDQSRPESLDPDETIVPLVSSCGQAGNMDKHARTNPEPFLYTGRILAKQVEFANGLESLQNPHSHGGLPIRPHMKITTLQSTQPLVEISQPMSADSVAYGSDVIRLSHVSRRKVDMTKTPPRRSCSTRASGGSSLSTLERTSSLYQAINSSRCAPVTSYYERSSCSEVQTNESSMLGHCNMSPSMQETLGDQSLELSILPTSAKQAVASVSGPSILFKRSTFGEQTFSTQNLVVPQRSPRRLSSLKLREKAAGDDNPVDSSILAFVTHTPTHPVAGGVRIRGPRPPPRVFSQWNTLPIAGSLV